MNVLARAWRAALDAMSGKYIRRTIYDRRSLQLSVVTTDVVEGALTQCQSGYMRQIADIYDLLPATDPHILGVRRQLRAGVQGLEMEPVAVSDDPQAKALAEALKVAIERPESCWSALLAGILEGYLRGASLTETMWEPLKKDASGNDIPPGPNSIRHWSGFSLVPQQRLIYDRDNGELLLVTDATKPTEGFGMAKFPEGKFVRCQVDEDIPDFSLRGTYRSILSDWFGRMNVGRWEQMAIERYGMPIPVIKYGSEAAHEASKAALADFGAAGCLLIDENSTADFGQPSIGSGGLVHEIYLEKSAERISVAFLGASQTVTIGKEAGSKASAGIHQGVRRDILYSIAELIAETVRRDLFVPFVRMNYGEAYVPLTPRLRTQFDEPLDLLTTAQAWVLLSPLFKIPEGYARELTGIPAPGQQPDGTEEPSLAAPPPASPAVPFPSGFPKAVSAAREHVPLPATPPAFGAEISAHLRSLVDSAKSTGALAELPNRIRRAPVPGLHKSVDLLAAEMMEAHMRAKLEVQRAREKGRGAA